MAKKTRKKKANAPVIHGTVTESRSGQPLAGLIVQVFDENRQFDAEHLGSGKTTARGNFEISFRRTKAAKRALAAFPKKGPDLIFRIYESGGTPLRISDSYHGKDRFRKLDLRLRLSDRDRINKIYSRLFEDSLLQEDFLKLASAMLARKYELKPDHVYKTLSEADPFGIDPFTWRTTVCCVLNNLMDTFKESPLGSQLLFNGGTYKHLRTLPQVTGFIRGPVTQGALIHEGVEGREEVDEDFNFKLQPTMPNVARLYTDIWNSREIDRTELAEQLDPTSEYFDRLHCEIIPCDQVGDLRRFMSQLKARARQAEADLNAGITPSPIQVQLAGKLTWDGRHGPWPGHLEMHPVTWARIL